MTLTDILYDAIDLLPDAEIAGVVGTDGLSVEMAISPESPFDHIDMVEMELASLAAAAQAASIRLGTGAMLDMIVETEYLTYLISLITPGYYVVLGVTPEGNLGRARFAVRQMVHRFREEL
ncbi:MAG: hypothetical protein HC893_16325 [Chloroflexaceae bacterium]|nr:hypothetical protein [Chloroflexaceae bacterium]NJO05606.1 hypothetical protein [Chloroflexaceae bacterium]